MADWALRPAAVADVEAVAELRWRYDGRAGVVFDRCAGTRSASTS